MPFIVATVTSAAASVNDAQGALHVVRQRLRVERRAEAGRASDMRERLAADDDEYWKRCRRRLTVEERAIRERAMRDRTL